MPSRSLSRSISRSRSPLSPSPSRSRSRSRSKGPAHRDDSRSPSPNRSNGRHPRHVDGEPYNHDQDADRDDPDRQENQRKERELADRLKRRAKKSHRDGSQEERGRSRTRSVSPISRSSRSRSHASSTPPSPRRDDDDDDRHHHGRRRSSKSSSRREKRHSNSGGGGGGREGKRRRRGKSDRRRGEEEGGRDRDEDRERTGGYDSDDLFNPKRLKGEGGRSSRRSERNKSIDQDSMTEKEREEYRERRRRELDEQDREFERQRQASSGSGRRVDDRSPPARYGSRGYGGSGGRRGGDSYRASRERDDGYQPRRPRRDSRSSIPRQATRSRSPVSRRARDDTHSPMGGKTFRSAAEQEDYESRSIFCSQLAVRLGQRDLGEFFEEELGEGSVRDVKIVTDRFTGRSKGIGYVELDAASLVEKAMALSGEKLFGIPILVQRSDAERNRLPTSTEEGGIIHRPNMPQFALPSLNPNIVGNIPLPPSFAGPGATPLRLGMEGGAASPANTKQNNGSRLYVGSLHFDLTKENVQAVFEPFGPIDSVELHTEPATGKSKGFGFIQFQRLEDAESALQAMNGFELAGRNIKVGHVSSRSGSGVTTNNVNQSNDGGSQPQRISGIDDGLGGKMTSSSRADLMEKLARGESASIGLPTKPSEEVVNEQNRPDSIPVSVSKALLLKNMFDPSEETEKDWDLDLTDDVKEECETKYGKVDRIYVEKESAGEIYVKFMEEESAGKALNALNGRWFGGKPITASYISEAFFNAKLG